MYFLDEATKKVYDYQLRIIEDQILQVQINLMSKQKLLLQVSKVVVIEDGNIEHVAHVCRGKQIFLKINLKFATVVDLNKCLRHKNLRISL